MKKIISFFLGILQIICLDAQSRYYILDSPHSGNFDYVARDSIILNPGFYYSPTENNTFTARTDENLIFPIVYNPLISSEREINTSLPVGSIKGNFEVSSTGAANYTIPLVTPPGTAELEPKISIVYNSQAGNGTLGYGWEIAGLSAISRVGKAHYLDGEITTVELNNNDRFALDGNRLIVTNGLDYGSDGSVYHTEMENFNKVIAHGTAGTGPEWFEVITKDGQTLEYGKTEDARVEPVSGTTPYMWLLNKIKDIHGNYIKYSYTERNGVSVIHKISYTGIEGGENPYNEILFTYEERSDIKKSFIKGKSILQDLILYKIEVYAEGSKVRDYFLSYNYNYFISRLVQIIEKAGNGNEFNSTIIEWGEVNDSDEVYINLDVSSDYLYTIGDFNNDGKDDFIRIPDKELYTSSDKWELFLSENGTNFTKIAEGNLMDGVINPGKRNEFVYRKNSGFQYLDFNGDGLMDLLLNQFQVFLGCEENICANDRYEFNFSNGGGFYSAPTPYYPKNYNYSTLQPQRTKVIFGDYNGDGKTNYHPYSIDSNHFLYNFDIWPLDYNGDGITDLMCINENENFDIEDACIIYNGKSDLDFPSLMDNIIDENTIEFSHGGYPNKWHRIFPGDFNGDGKMEFLIYSQNDGWLIGYSNDAGGYDWPFISVPGLMDVDPEASQTDNHIFVQDINSDGLMDIIEVYYSNFFNATIFQVYCNRGNNDFIIQYFNWLPFPVPHKKHFYFGDFNGDGRMECFISKINGQSQPMIIQFHPNETSHLVKSITNGLNYQYSINYKSLADPSVYIKGTSAPFPEVRDIQMPLYVVSSTSQEDGTGGLISNNYKYEEVLLHSLGRGFLGFKKTESSSEELNFRNINLNTLNTSKNILLPYSSEKRLYNGELVSQKDYLYSIVDVGNNRFLTSLDNIIETDYLNNLVNSSILEYDSYGNDTLIVSNIGEDIIIETRKQYQAFITDIPNRIIHESIYKKYDDEPPFVTETDYEYYSNGTLKKIINHPETNYAVQTEYQYTNRGLVLSESVSSSGLPARVNQYEYDNRQRFVTKKFNPEGIEEYKTSDPKTGMVTFIKDINGHTSYFAYDAFGRLVKTINSRGQEINHSLYWTDIPEIPLALYCQETEIPGKPNEKRYYDKLGREIRSETEGREGTIYSEKVFNRKGWITSENEPCYSGSPTPDWISYAYDVYGRLIQKNFQDEIINYSYGQKSKTTTNVSSGQSITETYNANGEIINLTDAGGAVTYSYHSSGQAKEINYGNHSVTVGYNEIGQQASLTDPNSGEMTYEYNAYDQLVSQEDANANTYTMEYDVMGRLISKTGPEGNTSYTYFTGSAPLYKYGLLNSVSGSNNISESYDYNQYGELTSRSEIIQGESFTYSYQYDNYGNLILETFPENITLTNEYDTKGFLQKITKNPGNVLIWEFVDEDKPGMITSYTRGTGLNTTIEYDEKGYPLNFLTSYQSTVFQNLGMDFDPSTGNLLSRVDNRRQLTESFQYDNLDRLTHSGVTGGVQLNMDYTSNGNILFKTDAGDYSYHPAKSNAVTEIVNNPQTIPFSEQEIDYTPFNKAGQITEDGKELTITYGPDQQRRKSVYSEGSLERTTIYGINYERVTVPGSTKHLYYLHSPTGLAAVVIKSGTEDVYFTTTDHLGSVTGLINATCQNLVEEYSFDAWGRRRNPVNWTYDNVPVPAYLTRGFTGHEHLDAFGLINMNGRMYDPVLARFLSPDNYVQMPFSTQGYNRYSYALNNPLKFSDPDGEWFITALFMLGNAYYNSVLTNKEVNPIKWDWGNITTYTSIGFGLFTGYSMGSTIENKIEYVKFRNGINQIAFDDSGITYNSNGAIEYSNVSAEKFVDYYFNKFPKESREALKNIYADARTIRGEVNYDLETKSYINLSSNEKVGAFIVPELNGNSDMYLAETIFSDKFKLYSSVAHELIHVHHNRTTLGGLHPDHPLFYFHRSSSEFWANKYMVDQNNKWASITKSQAFVKRANFYSNYLSTHAYYNYNPLFDYNLTFGIFINRVP